MNLVYFLILTLFLCYNFFFRSRQKYDKIKSNQPVSVFAALVMAAYVRIVNEIDSIILSCDDLNGRATTWNPANTRQSTAMPYVRCGTLVYWDTYTTRIMILRTSTCSGLIVTLLLFYNSINWNYNYSLIIIIIYFYLNLPPEEARLVVVVKHPIKCLRSQFLLQLRTDNHLLWITMGQ